MNSSDLGAGESGGSYATDFFGECNCDYFSSKITFFNINDYCKYGRPVIDFGGKLCGSGFGSEDDDNAFCNPYKLPITFRFAHLKEKILKSWSRMI